MAKFQISTSFSFFRWRNRSKYRLIVCAGAVCSLIVSGALTVGFTSVSMNNYPGGHAFSALHRIVNTTNETKLSEY